MADFNAIASAIATRFSSANVTPPAGLGNIRSATSALPQAIPSEPYVLVFPPEPGGVEMSYMSGTMTGTATFPVRFYLWKTRDKGRNSVLINKWLSALYGQLIGRVQLGLPSYVAYGVVRNLGAAQLTYAGEPYDGIALEVEVHIWEALNAVA